MRGTLPPVDDYDDVIFSMFFSAGLFVCARALFLTLFRDKPTFQNIFLQDGAASLEVYLKKDNLCAKVFLRSYFFYDSVSSKVSSLLVIWFNFGKQSAHPSYIHTVRQSKMPLSQSSTSL